MMEYDPESGDVFTFRGSNWLCTKYNINLEAGSLEKLTIEFIRDFGRSSQHQQPEEPPMNRSTTVFLVDDTVKALKAIYEDNGKIETFKTFDDTIKKDDLLVVESGTRHGFTVVKVTETDVIVDIEDNNLNVKWVVSKVSLDDHKAIITQEAAAIDKVRVAEFNKKKRDLVANMASPEDAEALRSIKVNPAIAPPVKV